MRKVYAPYSQSGENVAQTPLEGYIEIQQEVIPTIETGFVNENGLWIGNTSSDSTFIAYHKDEAIANSGTFTTPSANADGTWPLDMTGFNDLFFAIKPTNGGAYKVEAVMGPDGVGNGFGGLTPVNASATLRGAIRRNDWDTVLLDAADTMVADVWNIFTIQAQLKNQKLLQFLCVNNSGDISTIETAFMRMV